LTERDPTQLIAPDDWSLAGSSDAALLEAADGSCRLDVLVGGATGAAENGEGDRGRSVRCSGDRHERRVAETEQQALALTTPMDVVAGASRVKFPRLVPRLVPRPFSLSTVRNQTASDLGAQFATEHVRRLSGHGRRTWFAD